MANFMGDDDYSDYGRTPGGRRTKSSGMTCFLMSVLTALITLLYFRLHGEALFVGGMTAAAEFELKRNGVQNTAFRDRISEYASVGPGGRKYVVVTASNYAYRRLFVNFECMMRYWKVDNVVVNALDKSMHDYAFEKGYNVFNIIGNKKVSDTQLELPFHQGTRQFNYVTFLKFMLPLKVLQEGYDVIYSDLDVGFYGDFTKELYSHPEDLVTISDQGITEKPPNSLLGSGLFLARSSPGTIEVFFDLLRKGFHSFGKVEDQTLWNEVLCSSGRVGRDKCLLSVNEGEVYVHVLDREVYSPLSEFRSAKPMAVHFNKLYGRQQKWRQLYESKSWFLTYNGTCDPHRGRITVIQVEDGPQAQPPQPPAAPPAQPPKPAPLAVNNPPPAKPAVAASGEKKPPAVVPAQPKKEAAGTAEAGQTQSGGQAVAGEQEVQGGQNVQEVKSETGGEKEEKVVAPPAHHGSPPKKLVRFGHR